MTTDEQGAARVGQQQRRAEHGQRGGAEDTDDASIVGRGEVQAEHDRDRAEHAERVPVGQRIREPAGRPHDRRGREHVGCDAREQRQRRDGGHRERDAA